MAYPSTREMDVPGAPPGRVSGHTLSLSVPHMRSDNAVAKMPSDISLEQQQLDLLGPAYLLQWSTGQPHCSRERIGGAEELHAKILQQSDAQLGSRLFVIQGLPSEYAKVLRDELDVDPRFLEAHVGRRAYRPLVKRSRSGPDSEEMTARNADFACFEYPELLTSTKSTAVTTGAKQLLTGISRASVGGDVVSEAPTHAISHDGEYVMFCRASLWQCPKARVLLVDRPSWSRPSSEFRKAVYPSSGVIHTSLIPISEKAHGSSVGSDTLHSDCAQGNKDEIPCFETLLHQSLTEEAKEPVDDPALVEDIAIHQWMEFFEALSTGPSSYTAETAILYQQIQRSLERNLSQSQFYEKIPNNHRNPSKSPTTSIWESLLSRLSRHVSLLNFLRPPPSNPQPVPLSPSPSSSASNPRTRTQFAASALPPQTSHRSPAADEQNQQSLDRVSYMGGVLLPLSIVSSILSMSDPFGPGGSQFFIFWAVSIPLVFITILIIYADSIRKAEVWIEVASNSSAAGSEKRDEAEGKQEEGISMPEFQGGTGAPGLRRRMRTRTDGMATVECESDDGYGFDEWDEPPGMMVERLFKDAGKKKWRREQLGWMGACKAVFRIYKLKKGRPPNWATNVRRGNTV